MHTFRAATTAVGRLFLLLLADPFAVDHVASSDQRFVFPCGYFYFNGSESRFPVPDPAPSPAAEYGAAQGMTCYKSKISSLFGENCQKERLCIDLSSSSFYNICVKKLGSILVEWHTPRNCGSAAAGSFAGNGSHDPLFGMRTGAGNERKRTMEMTQHGGNTFPAGRENSR